MVRVSRTEIMFRETRTMDLRSFDEIGWVTEVVVTYLFLNNYIKIILLLFYKQQNLSVIKIE